MAEDLRRVAELIDFWKKLDLRTFQRELKSVQPELKCLLQEGPTTAIVPKSITTSLPIITKETDDISSITIPAMLSSSSPSSSPSTLPPSSPVQQFKDPNSPPTSKISPSPDCQPAWTDGETMNVMALRGLVKKIKKYFRVQDNISLLLNYDKLLKLVQRIVNKKEPIAELQMFLSTNGRRGRRMMTNHKSLQSRDSSQKSNPDLLPTSSELNSQSIVDGQNVSRDQTDQSSFATPTIKTPIGRYCPLTVPKYIPPMRPGLPSGSNMTSFVPSYYPHHRKLISSSSSSSFLSMPSSIPWTPYDTPAAMNGYLADDDDDDDDDGDDNDVECIDLRIESKRILSPMVSSSSSEAQDISLRDCKSIHNSTYWVNSTITPTTTTTSTRDPYPTMTPWIDDSQSVEKLEALNGLCRPSVDDVMQPLQQQQQVQLQQEFLDRCRDGVGGAWDLLTNGCDASLNSTPQHVHHNNNINSASRSVKRKRKSAGLCGDVNRNKRFFAGRDDDDQMTGVCDSSNSLKVGTKEDGEKKRATKELISRIYMKELERLVESAEKKGETVELQTYRDELEKIRNTLSTEKLVDGDMKSEDKIPKEVTCVVVKSEELFNVKSEKDEGGQGINFVGGRPIGFEIPNQPSPLQRIQSIFNSTVMKPTNASNKSPSVKQNSGHNHHGSHHNRGSLPPIDQHQLEAHLDINTEELVKKVREFLGRFSISQRLFGEKVLGLSQGSVSDLLARPKPWCVLTQKGREPFARMKMFLEDQDGIMTKLLTSQCKVMTSGVMTSPLITSVSSVFEDGKICMEFPGKVQQSFINEMSQCLVPVSTPVSYDKVSTGKQAIPLNTPLKIPLHTSSPLNSPKTRSPWMTSAGTDTLSSSGYLGNFPFSNFLPSVLSMIGNSSQTPPTHQMPSFLSPSPFFPLMVPGYSSLPSNLMRNMPYRFSCDRPGIDAPPNLGDNPLDLPLNGVLRCPSRLDAIRFHQDVSPFSFRNHQDSVKRHIEDKDVEDPSRLVIKEENISDSTEPIEKLGEDISSNGMKSSDQFTSINDDQHPSLPYVHVPCMTPTLTDKAKVMSEYSFRDVHQFELDTQLITARVKELLQQSNLGQKLFGEAVLELSQGSVSELLSKPKPWHLLSLKGREPFIKMNAWLADPQGVEKLRTFHLNNGNVSNGSNGYRGIGGVAGIGGKTSKRKTASEADSPSSTSSFLPQQQRLSFDGEKEQLTIEEEQKKKKRPRLFFTEEQKLKLREAYELDPYPSQMAIEKLARELNVGAKTVVNWFHNHRMRAKQVVASNNIPFNSYGTINNLIHQHIFSSVLSFHRDGKTELSDSYKDSPPSTSDDYRGGENLLEDVENLMSSGVRVPSPSVGVSFNKRKRSKPLKVPEMLTSLDSPLHEVEGRSPRRTPLPSEF